MELIFNIIKKTLFLLFYKFYKLYVMYEMEHIQFTYSDQS